MRCAAVHNNKLRKRAGSVKTCKKCGTEYVFKNNKPSVSFCSKCKPQRQLLKTLKDVANSLSARGKHPSWKWAYVRIQARSIHRAILKLACYRCNYAKHVELAHIKPISSFPLSTPLSEVNDRSNVVQLCPNCHWELDHGIWSFPVEAPVGNRTPTTAIPEPDSAIKLQERLARHKVDSGGTYLRGTAFAAGWIARTTPM